MQPGGKQKGTDNKGSMGILVVAKALHLQVKVGQEVWEAHLEKLWCREKGV